MAKTDLTAQRLRELLHYDPGTDTWRRIAIHPHHRVVMSPNRFVGSFDRKGYRSIFVAGKTYLGKRRLHEGCTI